MSFTTGSLSLRKASELSQYDSEEKGAHASTVLERGEIIQRQTSRSDNPLRPPSRLRQLWSRFTRQLWLPSQDDASEDLSAAITTDRETHASSRRHGHRRNDSWPTGAEGEEPSAEVQPVNVVVVDRDFNEDLLNHQDTSRSDANDKVTGGTPDLHAFSVPLPSSRPGTGQSARAPAENMSYSQSQSQAADGQVGSPSAAEAILGNPLLAFLRWRVWPAFLYFFHCPFPDPEKERIYVKENWFVNKAAALASAFFLLVATLMAIVALTKPYTTYAKIFYLGLGLASVLPLIPLAIINAPKRWPLFWQFVLFLATWSYPYIIVMDMWRCQYFTSNNLCPTRDFIGVFYYALGFPTFSLLMLQASRFAEVFGAIIWVVLVSVFLVPDRITFVRNLINFILYHCAITYAQFLREKADRRMFSLREQLKAQYRATQKAQIAERQASESKRRFVSYIFHEVRVPLNTALLAFQNLAGEKIFSKVPADQTEMITGLSSSLITMEKVLNDVLDFNRMEAGKLTWTNKPFNINSTFRSMLMAFRGVAAARRIELVTDFDPAIDEFSPLLLGDEMRFSQVISNLTSNACKFTQNGTVKFTTKLLHPSGSSDLWEKKQSSPPGQHSDLSAKRGSVSSEKTAVNASNAERQRRLKDDVAIVRIEIIDSGVGIPIQDLLDNRLFSPYVQTDIGRRQGGKGSGLGLALVRKIVKLSGGRLGVESTVGKGSVFWLELAFKKPSALPLIDTATPLIPNTASILPTETDAATRIPSTHENQVTSVKRAELVAAQIPTSLDVDGIPINPLPNLTPMEENPPRLEDGLRVLVVDDDPLTRKLMSRMLSRLGHVVTCAEDGLAAITLLREAWKAGEDRFDLVFLDNQMPRMTGIECVREMRRIGLQTFVLGCTGNALLSDIREYLDAGANQVLTKPVLEKNIRAAIVAAKEHNRLIKAG